MLIIAGDTVVDTIRIRDGGWFGQVCTHDHFFRYHTCHDTMYLQPLGTENDDHGSLIRPFCHSQQVTIP
jgi:hypothetical protein